MVNMEPRNRRHRDSHGDRGYPGAQGDGDHGEEHFGAGGYAQDKGAGDGVAEEGLEEEPGKGQGSSQHRRQHEPGQAYLPDYVERRGVRRKLPALNGALVEDHAPDLAHGYADAAGVYAPYDGEDKKSGQRDEYRAVSRGIQFDVYVHFSRRR